jgi:hypothetical protein
MDSQAPSKLDRRSFLKRAGIGSLALGPLPGLLAATPAGARGRAAGFNFTAISRAGTIGSVVHAVNMAGSGTIKRNDVEGGGHFQHYDLASAPPRTIIAAGAWRAKRAGELRPHRHLGRHHGGRARHADPAQADDPVAGGGGCDAGGGLQRGVGGVGYRPARGVHAHGARRSLRCVRTNRGRDHGLHDYCGGRLTD